MLPTAAPASAVTDNDRTLVRYAAMATYDAPHCAVPSRLALGRPVIAERAAAYGILMQLLREFGPFRPDDIAKDGLGRPHLPSHPHLSLSLAHTHGCAAAAVAQSAQVGIDVEALATFDRATAEIVLTPQQRALVDASTEPNQAFTRLWVRKEAVGKALGVGLDSDVLAAAVEQDKLLLRGVLLHISEIAAPKGIFAALALSEAT